LNLVLYKAVNGRIIYDTREFEMYFIQLKKYVLCTCVHADLSSDEESKGLNVRVINFLRD